MHLVYATTIAPCLSYKNDSLLLVTLHRQSYSNRVGIYSQMLLALHLELLLRYVLRGLDSVFLSLRAILEIQHFYLADETGSSIRFHYILILVEFQRV